jgi:glycosyltransferase involved in cell wall biosynthesis
MHYLVDSGIKLTIAGDGALEDVLKEQADDLENVFFIGRIEEPYSFFSDIDLLVVPSIREPLGNVCLEAGLCKVPVLATNIDGIPEIIENKVSGELIDPTIEVLINYPDGFIPLPEFVINPVTRQLCTPKQVDPSLLARKIIELSTEPEKLTGYADKLHEKVINYFNINRYCIELNAIYREIYFS